MSVKSVAVSVKSVAMSVKSVAVFFCVLLIARVFGFQKSLNSLNS